MATLAQEKKNLQSELQEHRVIAVEGNSRPVDTNRKGRQNATRVCNYCRKNWHTPSCCRKKNEAKNWKGLKMKGLTERKSPLPKTKTGSEDQAMNQ